MLVNAVDNYRRQPLAIWLVTLFAGLAVTFIAPEEPSANAGAPARASSQNFEESLNMRITKKHGNRLKAKGRATGTGDTKGSLKLHLITGSKARATFFGQNVSRVCGCS